MLVKRRQIIQLGEPHVALALMLVVLLRTSEALSNISRDVVHADVRVVACQLLQDLAGTDGLNDDDLLVDAGLDSLSPLPLRADIIKVPCTSLPASFVFDYPTIRAITDHLGPKVPVKR